MASFSDINGPFTIDSSHSSVGFVARHAMITKVRGAFATFSGEGVFNGSDPASSNVNVTIDVASIDTRSEDRDGHLRSADFFDIEKYPNITFTSTKVEATSDDEVEVTGDLTIKGITQSVTIPFEYTGSSKDPFGNQRFGFEGEATVNRKDFGLSWNAALETGGVLVSEKIKLVFEISAILNAAE